MTPADAPEIGRRSTAQSAAVLDALKADTSFRSAQQIYAELRTGGSRIGLSTVYRHLQAATDAGVVDVIHTPDGEAVYRYCGDSASDHHHHLVCRSCGRVEEVEGPAIERWAAKVAATYEFADVEHTVEIFGTCRACHRQRAADGAAPRT